MPNYLKKIKNKQNENINNKEIEYLKTKQNKKQKFWN